jgi:hypothetical protein
MKKSLFFALTYVFFSLPVFCQANSSVPSVSELDSLLKAGINQDSLNAILRVGKSQKREFIPYLEKLAAEPSSPLVFQTPKTYAEIALAKLGEKKYLDLILQQIDGENIFVQDVAIRKLAYVGGDIAYNSFYKLLDDCNPRWEKPNTGADQNSKTVYSRRGDQHLEPRSFVVMRILGELVKDPPVDVLAEPSVDNARVWKIWLEARYRMQD